MPARPIPTSEYLRALGRVFERCRGDRRVSDIAKETRGRLSRSTIQRLERGAVETTRRSEIELATFYGLTLAELHRRAWDLLGVPLEATAAGTLALTLTREDRDAVVRLLATRNAPTKPANH